MQRFAPLFLAIGLFPCGAGAQTFEPFPNGAASGYRFDLSRNFYPSPEAAARARAELIIGFRRVERLARHVEGARALYALLATTDTLSRKLGRQYAYLSLRSAIDLQDAESQPQLSALAAIVEPIQTEVERVMSDVSASRLAAYARIVPPLKKYDYAITLARRESSHRLDAAAERVLAAVESEATTWGPMLFQTMLATTAWGTVHAPEGDLDVRRQGAQIRSHPDRAVRETGFHLGQVGVASRRDTYAFILTREADARNTIARERHWPDYPSQAYGAGALTPDVVRALLQSVAFHSEVNKRYERARIAEIRREFGYDSVHVWDLTAPPSTIRAPRFTIQDATREVVAAAAPLGPGYARELRALLDPANGRLDLVARANRVDRQGFSTGSVGYPSTFFQGRFEGYVEDLVTLSHEAGHGVQNMMMDSAGVLPRYAGGPNYFTESFATLSQLLLLEHLYHSSTTQAERRYYVRRLLDDALEVYRTAHESLVELQLYDSVAVGHRLSADGIERLTQQTGTAFSVWFGTGNERADAWVQPLQFYTRPLYRVNYVIAKLLALKYLDMLHRDPAAFERQYSRLLRNGYDAPPEELLRRYLDVRVSDSNALTDGAERVVGQWMSEMEGP